ncbi:hypothetical protein PG997_006368 [Apiospora hydei]|uniref:Uncharacterized protein n=1 Tax=Apiospora hydei TaxID=1337664 RepID=A0ABR1WNL3_9PEZI
MFMLLNLGGGPLVQQVIDLSSAPTLASSAADANFPIMTIPDFFFNTMSRKVEEDPALVRNGAIWHAASIYTRCARCYTGNCTRPLIETLE